MAGLGFQPAAGMRQNHAPLKLFGAFPCAGSQAVVSFWTFPDSAHSVGHGVGRFGGGDHPAFVVNRRINEAADWIDDRRSAHRIRFQHI